MKIFLDTANIEEIKEAKGMGVLDGVTTNPTLIAKEVERTGKKFSDILKEICEIVQGPVSAEVISLDHKKMVEEAKKLAKISKHIVIKIPATEEGIKAIKVLSEEGIHTNCTLIFSPSQALLAMKAGATYLSPFIGRLDDISSTGMNLVSQILEILEHYQYPSEVIVSSVRHPMHVVESALMGAHIVTMPYSVFKLLMKHPLTDIGIERFLKDWEKVKDYNDIF